MKRWHPSNLMVLLLCAGMLSLAAAFVALRLTSPSDGARFEPDAAVWGHDGVTVTPLDRRSASGLRQGDVVIAVAGRDMEEWARLLADPGASRPRWQTGDVVTYTIVRGGRQISVPVTLGVYPIGAAIEADWGSVVFALAFALVGVFIFLRRPFDRAARALIVAGVALLSTQTWAIGLQVSDLVSPAGFWLYQLTAFVAYTLFWAALLHFALVFPRPHRFVARRRWLISAVYVSAGAYLFIFLITTRVFAGDTLDWFGAWTPGQGIVGVLYFAAALAVTVDTYRSSTDPVTLRQIRWIVFATALSGSAGLCLSILPGDVFGHAIISTNMLGVILLPIPISFALAITRYHLFDIDVIINRALVYGTLTALLAGFYFVGVVGAQALINAVTGRAITGNPGQESQVLIVVTTLVIAALFQPLRHRVQVGIDRRFYRHKYDARLTLERFGATLRHEVELVTLQEQLTTVVEETMRPAYVSVWLVAPRHARAGGSLTAE